MDKNKIKKNENFGLVYKSCKKRNDMTYTMP